MFQCKSEISLKTQKKLIKQINLSVGTFVYIIELSKSIILINLLYKELI